MNVDLTAAAIYAAAFLIAAFRAGMFQWLWASVMLWAGCGIIGAWLLPGVWGITHAGPLLVPHFYITAAGLFFFAENWKRQTESPGVWQADCRHVWLGLFAVSNMLMTAAFLLLAAVVWYHYPGGVSVFAASALLNLYALKPINWFVLQAFVALVLYLHRQVIMRQSVCLFSTKQLEAGLLLALFLQTVNVVLMMLEGRY